LYVIIFVEAVCEGKRPKNKRRKSTYYL